MKKSFLSLAVLIVAALALCVGCSGVPAHPDLIYIYLDSSGTPIPFRFGVDTSRQYNLTFPATVTGAQQNQILALSQFNNYGYSGVNPIVTTGNLFPPGTIPSTMISSDIPESASFPVTAANLGTMFQVTTGAAVITATLPNVATITDGFYFFVRKADAGLSFGAGQVIFANGLATSSIGQQGDVILVWSDGVTWYSRFWNDTIDAAGNLFKPASGSVFLLPGNDPGVSGNNSVQKVIMGPATSATPFGRAFPGAYLLTATAGVGTNIAGSNLTIEPGAGTGNNSGGSTLTFNVWGPTSSGSGAQFENECFQATNDTTTIFSQLGNVVFQCSQTIVPAGQNYVFDNQAPGTVGVAAITGSRTDGTVDILGTNTNDNGTAGTMGEYVTSNVATGASVSLTSPTAANVTQISLTAGDWDVWGNVVFTQGAGTTATVFAAGINTTTGNLGTIGANYSAINVQITASGSDAAETPPAQRLSLSTTTNVFLVAQSTFAVSTMKAYGFISARRRR